MTKHIFVNWKAKDVVVTTSRPFEYTTPGFTLPQGGKAKALITAGYTYVGYVGGFNISSFNKFKK